MEVLNETLLVYNYGFAKMFKCDERFLALLSLPAALATAFGFIFCYGRQMFAMARSGLFPTSLSLTTQLNGSPYVALIAGSVISVAVTLIGYFFTAFSSSIFQICICGAFCSYIVQLLSFVICEPQPL